MVRNDLVGACCEVVGEKRKSAKTVDFLTLPSAAYFLAASHRPPKSWERYRKRWNPRGLSDLARQLREFADALEKPASGSEKKAKE